MSQTVYDMGNKYRSELSKCQFYPCIYLIDQLNADSVIWKVFKGKIGTHINYTVTFIC